jgi:hypothetical protein
MSDEDTARKRAVNAEFREHHAHVVGRQTVRAYSSQANRPNEGTPLFDIKIDEQPEDVRPMLTRIRDDAVVKNFAAVDEFERLEKDIRASTRFTDEGKAAASRPI